MRNIKATEEKISELHLMLFVNTVHDLCQRHPDSVYQKASGKLHCSYTFGKTQYGVGCIMDQALKSVDICSWANIHAKETHCDFAVGIKYLLDYFDLIVEDNVDLDRVKDFLEEVQVFQDSGHTWKESWNTAVESLGIFELLE